MQKTLIIVDHFLSHEGLEVEPHQTRNDRENAELRRIFLFKIERKDLDQRPKTDTGAIQKPFVTRDKEAADGLFQRLKVCHEAKLHVSRVQHRLH